MMSMKEMSEKIKSNHLDYSSKTDNKIPEELITKGIEIETKEHPEITPESIRQLVIDHLIQDQQYYADEMINDNKLNEPEINQEQLSKYRAK